MESVRETFAATPELLLRTARRRSDASQLPASAVTAAARGAAPRVRALAPELMRDELSGLLMGPGVHLALQWLTDAALLPALLPELHATIDFSQAAGPPPPHPPHPTPPAHFPPV